MRAASLFVVFLALAACALSVSAQPPPRHESIIILFNDSACTQHLRTERVWEPPSSKCEPEEGRMGNFSAIFECTTTSNVTHLTQEVYNNTLSCDNTPIVTLTSAAAAHTCAPIAVSYEGQKAQVYGHIDCAPSNSSSPTFDDRLLALRQAAAASIARAQQAAQEQTSGLQGFIARLLHKVA